MAAHGVVMGKRAHGTKIKERRWSKRVVEIEVILAVL